MTSYRDWVVELSNTVGAGDYDLAGAPAGSSYFTFRQRFVDGEDEIVFWVVNQDRTKWEKNRLSTLSYGPPDTLTRAVVESTDGDGPISWVTGDLPLRVYVVPDSDAEQGSIMNWLATARHALLRFGHWFKANDPTSGKHSWKIFDGTSDIQVGVVDTANHTLAMACSPPGVVLPYAGGTAPPGFLLCFGQAVSRTTYAALFAVTGTTFGVGDGSTTFNLPDLRGRVAAGKDDMGGSAASRLTSTVSPNGATLGAAGGAQTNTASTTSSGTNTINLGSGQTGATSGGWSGSAPAAAGADFNALTTSSLSATTNTTPISGNVAITVSGTSSAFSDVQPTIILNQIISTGGV